MRGRSRPDDGHRGVGQCFRGLPVQRGTAGEVRRQARLEGSFRQHQHFLERPDVGEVQEKNRLDGPVMQPSGGERFGRAAGKVQGQLELGGAL